MVIAGLTLLTVFALGFGFWAVQAEQKASEALIETEKAKNGALQEKNKAVNALKEAYQSKIQELENTKSILESDNKTLQAKEYQQKIDSIQQIINNLK